MKEDLIKFLEKDCEKLQRKMEIALESNDIGTYKNLMRALSDANYLIRKNEWKLKFSEYQTNGHKEVAVWEQNYDGEIRNHKKWAIKEGLEISGCLDGVDLENLTNTVLEKITNARKMKYTTN